MSDTLVRIDTFTVPEPARAALEARIAAIHALLREAPGFRRDMVVARDEGPGPCEVITLVEWQDAAAAEAATARIRESHDREGFDPATFMSHAGITVTRRMYHPL